MVIRHSVKELLAKNSVTRPWNTYIVDTGSTIALRWRILYYIYYEWLAYLFNIVVLIIVRIYLVNTHSWN